jgi:hypothetical protein
VYLGPTTHNTELNPRRLAAIAVTGLLLTEVLQERPILRGARMCTIGWINTILVEAVLTKSPERSTTEGAPGAGAAPAGRMQCRTASHLSASQHSAAGRGRAARGGSVCAQPVRRRCAVGSTKQDAPPTTEQKEKEGECPFPFLHKDDGGEGGSEPRAHGATQVSLQPLDTP